MAELAGPAVTDTSFEAFRAAKAEIRAAEMACQRTWLIARAGDEAAWRRYRAALHRQERAVETLRHLEMIPGGRRSHASRPDGA